MEKYKKEFFRDKYWGRKINADTMKLSIALFFSDGKFYIRCIVLVILAMTHKHYLLFF